MSVPSNQVGEPVQGFASFNFSPSIHRGIVSAGFAAPRPIQEKTMSAALEGLDILGLAQTGTGKTAAFVLPILERLLVTRKAGPRVLILAPTRELASQICEEVRMLARYTPLKVTTVFGGVPTRPQIAELQKQPEIVVACPGRLLDLLQQRILKLDRIETLVLDEVDRMFDMGFLPDIRRIISAMPIKRQNLLFSATMTKEIRKLIDGILQKPHVVELDHSHPVAKVHQILYPVMGDDRHKYALLDHVLKKDDFVSAIVFTRTKHRARRLADQLHKSGYRAVALQGNMTQSQRFRAMDGFRKQKFQILVATDIAARGIDVDRISHVINFDVPDTADAYTHRIGRTGRAGKTGQAITFVTSDDNEVIQAVEQRIGARIPWQTVDDVAAPSSLKQKSRGRQRRRRRSHHRSTGGGSRSTVMKERR